MLKDSYSLPVHIWWDNTPTCFVLSSRVPQGLSHSFPRMSPAQQRTLYWFSSLPCLHSPLSHQCYLGSNLKTLLATCTQILGSWFAFGETQLKIFPQVTSISVCLPPGHVLLGLCMFSSNSRLPRGPPLLPLVEATSGVTLLLGCFPDATAIRSSCPSAEKPPASLPCLINLTQETQKAQGSQHPAPRSTGCLSSRSGNSLMHFREKWYSLPKR